MWGKWERKFGRKKTNSESPSLDLSETADASYQQLEFGKGFPPFSSCSNSLSSSFFRVFVADLLRKDSKNKRRAPTKGHWTAGDLSPRQPRCQLIAADISPTLLFQSKPFRCTAFLCFFTNRGHGVRNAILSEHLDICLIITQFALTVLSSFLNTANISDPLAGRLKVNTHRSRWQKDS